MASGQMSLQAGAKLDVPECKDPIETGFAVQLKGVFPIPVPSNSCSRAEPTSQLRLFVCPDFTPEIG